MAQRLQPETPELPSYQHMVIGLISGAMGPFSNAPIDTIKTRGCDFIFLFFVALTVRWGAGLQRATAVPGQSAFQRIAGIAGDMWRTEGVRSFYKGITPRVLRVAPGQAIVFAVYERVSVLMERIGTTSVSMEDSYSE